MMRGNLRQDLHDLDAGAYRWTDAALDRHIDRAVRELGSAWPQTQDLVLSAAGRRYDLTDQMGYLWCERVEYPVDAQPPRYLPFREEGTGHILLLGDAEPAAGDWIKLWYAKARTLDSSGSSIPPEQEELVALGAAGFAALELAGYAMGQLNPSGDTPQWYRAWGEARLKDFWTRLDLLRAERGMAVGWMAQWGATPRRWGAV